MSKSLSAAWLTELASSTPHISWQAHITRTDGTEYFFTTNNRAIVFSGDTYQPIGGIERKASDNKSDLAVDTTEFAGPLVVGYVEEDDIKNGLFAEATVEVFLLIWDNIAEGKVTIDYGNIGQISLTDSVYSFELRTLFQWLQRSIIRVVTPTCYVSLGTTGIRMCNYPVDPGVWTSSTAVTVRPAEQADVGTIVRPTTENGRHFICSTPGTTDSVEPTWNTTVGGTTNDNDVVWTTIYATTYQSETVSAVTNRKEFTISGLAAGGEDWFSMGRIEWLTGNNAGVIEAIKKHTSGGVFTLIRDMNFDIQIGDTCKLTAGCAGRVDSDCRDKFDNISNFQGFPHLPGEDHILRFGGQQG